MINGETAPRERRLVFHGEVLEGPKDRWLFVTAAKRVFLPKAAVLVRDDRKGVEMGAKVAREVGLI